MTYRQPSGQCSRPSWAATSIRWPSSSFVAGESPSSFEAKLNCEIFVFGITSMWVGATGEISRKARHCSSVCVWHNSFTCVTSPSRMCVYTDEVHTMYISYIAQRNLYVCMMERQRLVGSLKLSHCCVSFTKEPYTIMSHLQKRPINLRSLHVLYSAKESHLFTLWGGSDE